METYLGRLTQDAKDKIHAIFLLLKRFPSWCGVGTNCVGREAIIHTVNHKGYSIKHLQRL